MEQPVKFTQELLDQVVAALRTQLPEGVGYTLILAHPETKQMMMGTNLRNDIAMNALAGAARSLAQLEKIPGLEDVDLSQ